MIMPFGRFKGKKVDDVPTSYIRWLLENVIVSDELNKELENQLKLRAGEGVVRDKDYIERRSMKFKEDEND